MPFFNSFGAGQSASLVSAVAGFIVGAAGGFVAVVLFIVFHPIPLVGSLVVGVFISLIAVTTSASCERVSLRIRGYRRLSRDEVRRVAPLVKDAAEAMELPALPRFAMADQLIPNAWTHMRTVVVTTGLLQTLDDGELRAVLVHELQHWKQGDSVGLRCVWAASLPVVLIYNLGCLISGWSPQKRLQTSGSSQGIVRWLVAWLVTWPSWVMTKLILTPMLSASQRRYEYKADAAAHNLGFGSELSSALRKIGAFETGRTGWEAAMSSTHPPVELRLEALQQPRPDDWEYQEEELHGPTVREFFRMFGLGIRR
jgi:Zn-dependent protease with chaperone function